MSFIPNTTPTPNWLYNGEMKKMNETELKVVLLITRKTLGWFDSMSGNQRKQQDFISQKQFIEFTGQSHTAIAKAIQTGVEKNWIIAKDKNGKLCDTSEKRRRRKVWYQLGNLFIDKISKQQSGLDENLSNKTTQSKQQNVSNLSNKVDNTKETSETFTKSSLTEKTVKPIISWEDKIKIIETTKTAFGLQKLDDSGKWNLIYAGHFIKKCGSVDNALKIIELASKNIFWRGKITKVRTLWANCVSIVNDYKQKADKVSVHIINE